MLPRVLKNFNVFVEGQGYAGRVSEFEPPTIKIKTDNYRGGGMDGEKAVDMGMDLLTAKMTFTEFMPFVMKRVALSHTELTRVQLRGAIRRNNEDAVAVVVDLHGSFDESSMSKWKSGDRADHEVTMNVGYYKVTIGGDRIYEIDVDNCIRIIGDTDVLESIRVAIGI